MRGKFKRTRRGSTKAAALRAYKRYQSRSVVMSRRPKLPTMTVSRTFWLQHWSPSTIATSDFWRYLSIQLGQVPNVSEYTNLFDTYRINNIKWTFRPRYDSFAGNDTTDTTLPGVTNQAGVYAHVIIDPKSPQNPSGLYTSNNLNTFLENGTVKTYTGNKPFSIMVKYPCISEDINGVTNSKYTRGSFITCANNGIAHRGAHVFMQDVNLTGVFGQQFDVFVTMSMTFKGQR